MPMKYREKSITRHTDDLLEGLKREVQSPDNVSIRDGENEIRNAIDLALRKGIGIGVAIVLQSNGSNGQGNGSVRDAVKSYIQNRQ